MAERRARATRRTRSLAAVALVAVLAGCAPSSAAGPTSPTAAVASEADCLAPEVLDELRPHAVAVEGVFRGQNARSALQLGHARGVALLVCGERALGVSEYPPATVKRAVAGNGRATKEQVSRMVRMLCALERAPILDASDALAVAICHAFRRREVA